MNTYKIRLAHKPAVLHHHCTKSDSHILIEVYWLVRQGDTMPTFISQIISCKIGGKDTNSISDIKSVNANFGLMLDCNNMKLTAAKLKGSLIMTMTNKYNIPMVYS